MRRRWMGLAAFGAILVLVVSQCGSGSYNEPPPSEAMATMPASAMARAEFEQERAGRRIRGVAADAAEAADAGGAAVFGALTATQTDRYLIKTGSLALEVEDVQQASDAVVAAVTGAGGYISDMRAASPVIGSRTMTVQVRVPADRFEELMRSFEGMGKVLDQHVTSQDVTEEYVDTEALTRNLKKTEERLLAHLERTAKLEDILNVERELTRVRGEIERLEGRLRFLSNRVSFSTVSITLLERAKAQTIFPKQTYSTANVASEAARSLVRFAQSIWTRVIWLAVWAAVWVPVLAALWIAARVIRRKRSIRTSSGS